MVNDRNLKALKTDKRIFKAETKDLQGADAAEDSDAPAAVDAAAPQASLPPATAADATPAPAKPQAERAES
jgi:hypothetical protein